MRAILSEKGQVTIPKPIRDLLDLRAGGKRDRLVPDSLIAAHAQVAADRLLTRDRGFYRRWFSGLRILAP